METHRHPDISVVTPVYGCRGCLVQLCSRLRKTLKRISPDFEISMVDDASPDNGWAMIEEICAGLDQMNGGWAVVLDCDLQDQPEEILKIYARVTKRFDVVLGEELFDRTGSRSEPRRVFSLPSWAEEQAGYLLGPDEPQDIAGICEYLLSDDTRWISGQQFVVDGGKTGH
jgi:glycosyltransferase involved in cell wall biosynthesis